MGFFAALAALAGPITARVLIALGFSVVTITGVALSVDAIKSQLLTNIGQAPMAALQLIGLGGGWIALGMIFGAMTWCVSFWTLTKAQSIIGMGGGA